MTNGETSSWERADRILERALDLEGACRESYVVEACAGDRELEQLVRRLLANCAEPEERLVTGGALGGTFAEEFLEEFQIEEAGLEGTVIGRYKVISELGRGGMAVVYLAERVDDDFHQLVAIKLLQTGAATDDVVRRFLLERQILAQARHSGVAQLLDGGVTDNGRPYLVMEYVDGLPIDSWADEQRLTIEDRLRLFLKVARAVAYAHRNLVVHRDIKPSNILVNADGDVKLLDFGIAKLLDEDADATRSLLRAMTPAYASPEQIRGERVSTATDVYQLGMLLFILLTGRWPYRSGGTDPSLLLAICESEPVRPSAAIFGRRATDTVPGKAPISAAEIEGTRRSTISRLRRELSGDLDAIVLTALRKEPDRRYASVGQLITDVERFLEGKTVTARPETLVYRLRKLVVRHAVASAMAVTAAGLIVGLTVVYTVRLERERDRAQLEAAKATEVADFMRGLFEVSVPTRAKGEAVTARELLDRGAERLDDLEGQPELQASMATVIGEVYGELALYEEARDLLEKAVATRRLHPGDNGLELAESLDAYGRMCERVRDLEAARPALEEALSIREAGLGPSHADTARTRNWLGVIVYREGNYAESRALLERSLADLEAALGPDDLDVGRCLNHLAIVLREQREYAEAIPVFERSLAILDARLEEDNPLPAAVRVNYADAVRYNGDPERADRLLTDALPLMEKAYGADHPYIGVVLTNHANLAREQGRFEEAERMQRRALDVWTQSLGPDHVQVSYCYNNLGLIRREQGDHRAALDFFQQSVDLVDRTLGPDDPENAVSLRNLGMEYLAIGRPEQALEPFRRSVALHEKSYGPDHSFLQDPLLGLGRALVALGRPAEAEPFLVRAVAVGRSDDSHRTEEVVGPTIELARCVAALGRREEAMTILDRAAREGGDEARTAVEQARSDIGA